MNARDRIDRLLIRLWTWWTRQRTDRGLRRIARHHQRLEQQELARARLEMAAQIGDRRAQRGGVAWRGPRGNGHRHRREGET